MALHGTVGEFDAAVEDWTAYSERLEQYIPSDKRCGRCDKMPSDSAKQVWSAN